MRFAAFALGLAGCANFALGQAAWRAGQFGEVVTGKSTRKDVVRLLGRTEPKRVGRLEQYTYSGKGDFSADVVVEVNAATGVVEAVTEQFTTNITRTQAYRKYGRDYNEIRYSIANCPHESVNPLVFRDPQGPIEMIEYPGKGLVLWPNRDGFDIAAAVFLAKPLPKSKPKCGTK